MKKIYIVPELLVMRLHGEQMMATSVVNSAGDINEIGYGGVDEEGVIDPSVREHVFEDTYENPYDYSYEDESYYNE